MFRLDLEKAEEPEFRSPTSAGSKKKHKGIPETKQNKTKQNKTLTMLKSLCRSQQTSEKF